MGEIVRLDGEELRQLQLNELEMVAEVDRICRKNNIQYSLDGGTLLGAIRHKGYIPWDDDADVIFSRKEYEKFFEACKTDLDTDRFFLQDYRTDKNYRWGYAKIRRKGTEFVRVNQENLKYVGGIYIDVFVKDNVPDNPILRELFYWLSFCIRKILYSELGKTQSKSAFLRAWYRLLYLIPKDTMFKLRNSVSNKTNKKDTKIMCHMLYPYPKRCKYGMPSEVFKTYTDVTFEGMKFRAFAEYDRYLSILYGDYMKLPPVDQQVGHADATYIKTLNMTLEEIQERYRQ